MVPPTLLEGILLWLRLVGEPWLRCGPLADRRLWDGPHGPSVGVRVVPTLERTLDTMWKAIFTRGMALRFPAPDQRLDPPERQWRRAYLRELGAALVLYLVVLVVVNVAGRHVHGSWRYVVVLAPMVPFCGIAWAMARMLQRVDEMVRQEMYQALALSWFGTAIITFGYGFVEQAGAPHLSAYLVFPLMMGLLMLRILVFHVGRSRARRDAPAT